MENHFICPITKSLMITPVILIETGQSYEKEAIETWFASGNDTCPCTGVKLKNKELTINYGLRNAISEYMNSNNVKSSISIKNLNTNKDYYHQSSIIPVIVPETIKEKSYTKIIYNKAKSFMTRRRDNVSYENLIGQMSIMNNTVVELKKAPMKVIAELNNAIKIGNRVVIDKILVQKWNLNAYDDTRYGPIHVVAMQFMRDDAELTRALLQFGCDPDFKDDINQCTALHWASRCSNVRIIEVLISEGANVNSENINGITPLHLAAYWGAHNTISLLLKNGADRNKRSHKGERPVDYAMSSPKEEASGSIIMLRK